MPVSQFHAQVAAIALRVAAPHGFALAGGNALIAHGITERPTQDVDVFSDEEGGVEAAAGAVEAELRGAGYQAERRDDADGLADIFYGIGEGLAEWIITAPGGEQMMLQMAYFDRARKPVIMDVGQCWISRTWSAARSARWPAGLSRVTMWTPRLRWSGTASLR
jgi:hypothetical protein